MRNPGGYALVVGPEGVTYEADTFTCHHCQLVVYVQPHSPASDAGGWCGVCAKLICGPCADKGVCIPWEKQMEKMEARDRFLRSAGL